MVGWGIEPQNVVTMAYPFKGTITSSHIIVLNEIPTSQSYQDFNILCQQFISSNILYL